MSQRSADAGTPATRVPHTVASARPWRVKPLTLAVAMAFGGLHVNAWSQALPTGGQVSAGAASISQPSASKMVVNQTTDKVAINWQSFNIGAGNTVQFVQPSSSSIALNRVIGNSRSEIYGNLSSNGQVFLVNGNGVLFGPSAQVDVGGLVASTLNITDQNFLAGNYVFSDPNSTGTVTNNGTLNANGGGYLALIGNQAINNGTMTARLGSVVLGAGSTAQLTLADNRLIKFEVQQGALNALAQNGGLIQANGGQVILTAGAANELLASTVNNTGVIEAQTVQSQPGHILLLSGMHSGTTNVGGTLDASAPAALNPNGGDGGFIETSGASVKIASGTRATTAADAGLAGTWLIDPTDFTVAASGGDMTGATLSASLGSGNVNIQSSSGAAGTNGNVNINDTVTWSANQLTLTAAKDVNINAVMTASNTASLDLEPGSGRVNAALGTNGFTGRVDFVQADGVSPRGGTGFLTINGAGYNVLTSINSVQRIYDNLAGNYALGSNIDAGGFGFVPLGAYGTPVSGAFNGLGHTIANLNISQSGRFFFHNYGAGFISRFTGSAISNFGLVGSIVTGTTGVVGGLVAANRGNIFNSYFTGTVSGAGYEVGGLVGDHSGGTIDNSFAAANVSNSSGATGGLVGEALYGSITRSHASGSVSGGRRTGGLVGYNGVVLDADYATGTVSGGDYSGGLVGFNGRSISNSYFNGSMQGGQYVGGFVGINSGTITNSYADGVVRGTVNVGGFAGENAWGSPGSITNSYVSADITATTFGAAGFVALNGGGTIANDYYYAILHGQILGTRGVQLSAGQVMSQSSYAGLDFTNTWILYNGFTKPLLRSVMTPLTITAGTYSKTYDGTGFSATLSNPVYSIAGADTSGLLNGLATPYAGDVNAGVYTPNLWSGQQGYAISYSGATLTINPAGVTVGGTPVANNKVYDATTAATVTGGTLSGVLGNDVVVLQGEFASKNVGSGIDVTATLGGPAGGNYVILNPPSNLAADITKATLMVTGNVANNKVYDATTVATLGGTARVTALGSDVITLDGTATATFDDKNVGTGKAVTVTGYTLGGADAGNYILLQQTGLTATITKADLSLTGLTASNKVYDGTTVATLNGTPGYVALGTDVVTLSGAGIGSFADKNVGTAKAITPSGYTLGGTDGGNYNLVLPSSVTADITPKPITVDAAAANKVYDATVNATVTLSSAGVIGTDVVNFASNPAVFADKNAGNAKTVTVSGISSSGTDASNYTLTSTSASTTADITPKPLASGYVATSKAYDGTTAATVNGSMALTAAEAPGTGTATDGMPYTGDLVSISGTLTATYNSKDVATANSIIMGGLGLGGAQAGNYLVRAEAATITPKPLTVTGLSSTSGRVYDGTTVLALNGTAVLSGMVGTETLNTLNYGALAAPDVGVQAVTGAVRLVDGSNGGLASNYSVIQPGLASATITQLASATWVGGSSGNWSNPANWAPSTNLAALGAVPSLSNVAAVVIPAGVAVTYDNLPGSTVLSTLNAGSGGNFTFNGGSLTVGSGSLSLANLTLNSGTLNMGAGVNVGSYVQNGGTWRQVGATLPAFSADNFSLGSGVFLRALGGNGSSASPYQLTDLYGVQGMRGLSGNSFVLVNDVDATATANWNNGVGFLPIDLNGSFDGQGHSVNGITINSNRSDSVGFFSRIGTSGTVSNFGLRGGTVSDGGAFAVGGLAGANYGTITNSYSTAVVSGGYFVGGLVGFNAGGTISKTYATGRVTGISYVGGLVGYNSSTISDSYATGAVQLTNYGRYAGGLAGVNGGTITRSYATGRVTGGYGLGAFVGQASAGTYGTGGNFYDKSVNPGMTGAYGLPDMAGGIWGLSTADMRNRSNFNSATAANGGVNPGWDMTGTWLVYDSYTAPLLRPFLRPLTVTVNDATKTYDGTTATGGNGLSYSMTPDANLLGTAAYSTSGVNVGSYALGVSGLYSNQDGYIISYAPGNLTINPASLTVTANAASRTYGSANPVLTGTVTGLVNGETLGSAATGNVVFTTTATLGSNAGSYDITGSGLTVTNSNYRLVQDPANASALTVTPATLTVTASSASRTYGAANPAMSGTVTGFVNGDTLTSATTGAEVFSSSAIGTSNVGSYDITGSGLIANNGNYIFVQAPGNASALTVTPAPLTITAANASKTYGQTPVLTGFTSSGLQNGETIGSVTETSAGTLGTAGVAGGPYAITASNAGGGTFSAGNYNITYVDGSLTVNPASLTVTASNASKTYGQTPVLTGFTSSGLQNGETIGSVTETSAGTLANAGVAAGPYAISAGNASGGTFDAANYNISYVSGSLTVTPAPLTVTASNASKVYGQTPTLTGFTSSGLQNGETIGSVAETSAGTAGTAGVAGGPYAIVASGATGGSFDASNYSINYVNGSLAVTPAPLTVTASNASKTYGQTPVLTGFTSSGLQNGETIGSVTESSAGAAGTASVAGGPYAISASGASGGSFDAANYNISYVGGSLTVNPASLTVTASNASKTYGQTPVLTGFTASGLQNGETIGSVTETSAGTAGTASVAGGPYAITAGNASGGTFDAANYNISYVGGSLTVNPASLTVTASNASKTYGQTPVLTGFTASGLQNGETIGSVTETSAGTAGTASVAGGPYAITAGNASGGTFDAANYTITYANGSLTVTPAPLTVTASNASKTYGQIPVLTGFTSSGLQNGETIGSVTETSAGTVGTAGVTGGPYAIVASGATGGTFNAGNYNITYANGSLTVTPAPLTVTASNASKTYGQAPVLTGFTSSGLQNGETIGSVTETSAGTTATASVAGGPYAISASNASGGSFNAGNYTITYANGSLTVTPAPLTVTASNASKTYGQTPVLTGFTSSGLQNGETIGSVTETSAGTTATASVAGGPYAISASNASGGSFNAGNYTITYNDGSLTVTPAPLTVTASNASKTYGQTPVLTGFTSSGLQNGESIGSVTETSAGTSTTASVAGGPYAISASNASGGSFNAGNYTITYNDGSLTVTPATLTVTANAASRTYGAANPALSGTVTGFVNSETAATATTGTEVFTSGAGGTSSVGSYDITGAGLTANNGNYVFVQAPGNATALTVTPAPLTITAANASKTYGQTPTLTGFTAGGLQNGETVGSVTEISAGTTGTASVAGGPYAIVASGATGGTFDATNYSINYVNGSLTVAPAPLTITAANASKTYGQTPVLTGFTSSGLQNGETIGSVTETSAGTAANAGVAGGPYAISASNAGGGSFNAGNYNISYADGSLTVNPAPLTITANSYAKPYDGIAYSGGNGVWYSGYVNGENGSVLGGSLTWGGTAQGAVAAGGYTLTPGGLTSSNYAISYVDGTLLINAAPPVTTASLPPGAQGAVTAATQTGQGANGAGSGNPADWSGSTGGGSQGGPSLADNGQEGGAQNGGADTVHQSAAPIPEQDDKRRDTGRSVAGQLFTIVGAGQKLPDGVE